MELILLLVFGLGGMVGGYFLKPYIDSFIAKVKAVFEKPQV